MYKLKLNDKKYDALTKAELVNLILSWDDLANSPAGTQEEAQYDFCQLVKNFYQIFDYTDLECNYFVDEDTADECFNYIKGTSKEDFPHYLLLDELVNGYYIVEDGVFQKWYDDFDEALMSFKFDAHYNRNRLELVHITDQGQEVLRYRTGDKTQTLLKKLD